MAVAILSSLSPNTNKKSGSVYLDYAAGLWNIKPITDNLSSVSYALYMDSGGLIADYLNDLLTSQSILTLYKGVLKKSRKESK